MKQKCDGLCSNQAAFVVRLRDRNVSGTDAHSAVCGRHLAWAVRALERDGANIKRWRAERGVTYEGVVLVSTLKKSDQEGGTDG